MLESHTLLGKMLLIDIYGEDFYKWLLDAHLKEFPGLYPSKDIYEEELTEILVKNYIDIPGASLSWSYYSMAMWRYVHDVPLFLP